MHPFKKALVIVATIAALLGAGYGLHGAVHSPLFLVQVVEVADQPEQAPVDAATITSLAAIPVGQVNLFDLDLKGVERRILTNEWVREVRIQKRFPQTVSISIAFREPKALLQSETGVLSYVDVDGKAFGRVNLIFQPDLPVLSGFEGEPDEKIQGALRLVAAWEKSPLGLGAPISAISYDSERGYRAVLSYALDLKSASKGTSRSVIDLGQAFDGDADAETARFERISQVIHYLSSHAIAARQIFADAGKKIVVKTAHGS